MVLCDSNILIEHFKGNSLTTRALKKIAPSDIIISSVSLMELLYGAKNKSEVKSITKALNALKVVHISSEISIQAAKLIESYSKSHGLTIPDALIAATTLVYDFELFTYNLKDFRFIKGIQLYKA